MDNFDLGSDLGGSRCLTSDRVKQNGEFSMLNHEFSSSAPSPSELTGLAFAVPNAISHDFDEQQLVLISKKPQFTLSRYRSRSRGAAASHANGKWLAAACKVAVWWKCHVIVFRVQQLELWRDC